MTEQIDCMIPVNITVQLDPTSQFSGQLDAMGKFMACATKDGTLADLRAMLIQDKIIGAGDESVFMFNERIVGKNSETRIKWHSALKDGEVILARMATSLFSQSRLGEGVIIGADHGPLYAGHAVIADVDSHIASLRDRKATSEEIMFSYSETIAKYARAGWAKSAIDTVFPASTDNTRTRSDANVWITGRHLSSMCQVTLPVPHDLRPHPALKAAVELALIEQDITRGHKKLDNVWRRFGMFYVSSVEMGGMYHATEMVDVAQKKTGEEDMRHRLARQVGHGRENNGSPSHAVAPADYTKRLRQVGGGKDKDYEQWMASLVEPSTWSTTRILHVVPVMELFDEDIQARIASLSVHPSVREYQLPLQSAQTNPTPPIHDFGDQDQMSMADHGNSNGHPPGLSPASSSSNADVSRTILQMLPPGQIAPLEVLADRETPASVFNSPNIHLENPKDIERVVKALLDELTDESFDETSEKLIACANRSETERDAHTLDQVVQLIFDKAIYGTESSSICARLCRKMMEKISPKVWAHGIETVHGRPVTGGHLFRKYLLNRCQEVFECNWAVKNPVFVAASTDVSGRQFTTKIAASPDGANLDSDEGYIARQGRSQCSGLGKFLGELFKLQMLTKRIMHECVQKVLGDDVDKSVQEEEIEFLCQLLTTIGALLDTPEACAHMDVYFSRMKHMKHNGNVNSRMQVMLQDIIELRERRWISRDQRIEPVTMTARRLFFNMLRDGPLSGPERDDTQVNPGGEVAAGDAILPVEAANVDHFGKTRTFVTAGAKKHGKATISPTAQANNSSPRTSIEAKEVIGAQSPLSGTRVRSRRNKSQNPLKDIQRVQNDILLMSGSAALKTRINQDCQTFFSSRDVNKAGSYFLGLPAEHTPILVDKLVATAIGSEADMTLVADLFACAVEKKWCSADAFEEGFVPTAEYLDLAALDVQEAVPRFANLLSAAGLNSERKRRVVAKCTENESRLFDLLDL